MPLSSLTKWKGVEAIEKEYAKEYAFAAVLDFTGSHIAITFPDLEEALSQADNTEQAVRRTNEVLKLTIGRQTGRNRAIIKKNRHPARSYGFSNHRLKRPALLL
jgi:hypothetical protein